MRTLALSRRRLLLSTAVLGAAGVAAGASRALAFSVEQMNVHTEALAMSACQVRPNAYHQQLIAEITAALQGRPQPEINAQLAAAVCPLCGCPIE